MSSLGHMSAWPSITVKTVDSLAALHACVCAHSGHMMVT